MELNRRRYIATIATTASTLALAGCSGDGTDSPDENNEDSEDAKTDDSNSSENDSTSGTENPTHQYVPEPWDNLEKSRGSSSNTITGRATLEQGQFAVRQSQFDRAYQVEVSVTVDSGGPIDVYGMSKDEFDRYRDGETAVYYDGFVETGSKDINIIRTLREGEHRIVFDNSSAFGTESSGKVELEFETVVRA